MDLPFVRLLQIAIATVVVVLTTIFWYSSVRKKTWQKATISSPKKVSRDLALRVDKIPVGTSAEKLRTQVLSAISADPDLHDQVEIRDVHHITARDSNNACATLTVRTVLSESELFDGFERTGKPYLYDCTFSGITPLYEDVNGAKYDLVAVPGLASHAFGSWKSPKRSDIWLRDWISQDIPGLRILLYGYDTSLLKSESTSTMDDLGQRLLESLSAFRKSSKTEDRPIIFIGHSLGGLLIKEALIHASRSSHPADNLLSQTCCGLLFFGVPQLGLRNETLISIVEEQPNQNLIREIVVTDESEPSSSLKRMSNDFARCFEKGLRVVCFYEGKRSPTVQLQPDGSLQKTGPSALLVTEQSATNTGLTARSKQVNVSLDADHSGLIKMKSQVDDHYNVVKQRIKSLLDEAVCKERNRKPVISESARQCISDLRITDPRDDKTRIEDTKGGLLVQSYAWVLDNPNFRQWQQDDDQRLLWIKGDPGKGKTMLVCGIIDELEKNRPRNRHLSYFFCQATDARINNATAVLRGLIFMLVEQDPSLLKHVEQEYEIAGKLLFEDTNAWNALERIFKDMLSNPVLEGAYLTVDALDECGDGRLSQLLKLIVETSRETRAKWLISSRNENSIEKFFFENAQRLSLEVNATLVEEGVKHYIQNKVHQMKAHNRYSAVEETEVCQYLTEHANGTFLWVALVCQALERMQWIPGDVENTLRTFPAGLDALYERMIKDIQGSGVRDICVELLELNGTAYRPLALVELATLLKRSYKIADNLLHLQHVIDHSIPFLTVRRNNVYFIHQSAKDFLDGSRSTGFLPKDDPSVHGRIVSNSLKAMSPILKQNIYDLEHPGTSLDEITIPEPDPLSPIKYSCTYWLKHLIEYHRSLPHSHNDQRHESVVFLRERCIYWIESLSLLQELSEGMRGLQKLAYSSQHAPDLQELAHDAYRFLQTFRPALEQRPLQTYACGLSFSPTLSLIRQNFSHEKPPWIDFKKGLQSNWDACEMTLEAHSSRIYYAILSSDGRRICSASSDTFKLWDVTTGTCEGTFKGNRYDVEDMASFTFSPDNSQVLLVSRNGNIQLWDVASGIREVTLGGQRSCVTAATFSPDGCQVVSVSTDGTIQTWSTATGACVTTLVGHLGLVTYAAFSADSSQVASAAHDGTVKLWKTATGKYVCQPTEEGYEAGICGIKFSADSRHVLWFTENTIKLWNTASRKSRALAGHAKWILSAVFSSDSSRVASASSDGVIKLWDTTTEECEATLQSDGFRLYKTAFSADCHQVILVETEGMKLYDIVTGRCKAVLEGHTGSIITSVVFSPVGSQILSTSGDGTIKLWNPNFDIHEAPSEAHKSSVSCITFSADGRFSASTSYDKTIKLWDAATGRCTATLEGHTDEVYSALFSVDGRHILSTSGHRTVKLWEVATGECKATSEGHLKYGEPVAFSEDGCYFVLAASDYTIRLWDVTLGSHRAILMGHTDSVTSVAFSADGEHVVSGSVGGTIKIWTIPTGLCTLTIEVPKSRVTSAVFSADGQQVVTGDRNGTVKLWDIAKGTCKATFSGHSQAVSSVALSNDGHCLVTGDCNVIRVWNVYTGRWEAKQFTVKCYGFLANSSCTLVHTERGTYSIGEPRDPAASTQKQLLISEMGYFLSEEYDWILKDTKPVLWLPPAHRPLRFASYQGTFFLAGRSGHICVFHLR